MNINNINNKLIENISTPMAKKLENKNSGIKDMDNISFGSIMNQEIKKLNNMQVKADNITNDFIAGNVDNMHDVLIATEEARLSLELAVQVRNKFIEAYKEINNMQL